MSLDAQYELVVSRLNLWPGASEEAVGVELANNTAETLAGPPATPLRSPTDRVSGG